MPVVHGGFTVSDVIPFKDQWLHETLCLRLAAVTLLSRCGGSVLASGIHFCPMSVTVNHSCSSVFVRDLAEYIYSQYLL